MMGGPGPGNVNDPTVARLLQDLATSRGEPLEVVRLKYPDRKPPYWTADRLAAARAHGYQPTRRGGLSDEEPPCASD